MESLSPIFNSKHSMPRFITIGEIMLRLTPPDFRKIRMANTFEVSYGGSEANIALSLANLGIDSTFFSVVPDNSLGKSAVRWLRSNDVHCSPVILSSEQETPSERLGVYYYEAGFGIRAGKVIYDRKHSAITEYDFSDYDLKALLSQYNWLHLSGITPPLSVSCGDLVLEAIKTAKELGMVVSFDGNYREALWSWEEARNYCTKLLPYVDVLFGIEPYHLFKDPEDPSKGDWKDAIPRQPSREEQEFVFKKFVEAYPNIQVIARHVRYTHSGSENSLMAYMWYQGQTYESKLLRFNILDRIGGGDAFASGILYGLMKNYSPLDTLNFGVAISAIKHTLHGDGNITDDLASIHDLMDMKYDVKR